MKILEIVNFSSGISGTFTRAYADGREFVKRGYDVHLFSSDETEDGQKVESEELLEGIQIKRFPIKKRKGYALWFDFEKEAIALKPHVIIAHGLRKPYLNQVLKIAKKIGAQTFLITHAPFIDKELRSNKLNFMIKLYDLFIGKKILNSFDKVIAICKWEREDLLKLGCKEDKIVYLPNSLPEEFFTKEHLNEENKILFLGRMNPVKELEVLIEAFNKLEKTNYILEIVSSKSGEYFESLKRYESDKVIFTEPIYDLNKKIEKIDSCKIFVLPSRKESLPFGLIEAMSRGKIVISTRTLGGNELIDDCKNGLLFDIGSVEGLVSCLEIIIKSNKEIKDEIKQEAKKKAEAFRLKNNFKKWEELFNG